MQVYPGYSDLPEKARRQVVVIGNFDGVHRGHKALLEKAQEIAAQKKTGVAVLTFEPHPRKLFRPDDPPFRITPPDLKMERLEIEGVDTLYQIAFDWDFASRSAESFVKEVLLDGLGPAHVVVGYDFRFGQLRKGSAATIEAAGIPVSIVNEVEEISSTAIRHALRSGEIEKANALLEWEWEVRDKVIKGDQRGRILGFPTANFPLGETAHPAYGVYAARVNVEGETGWREAAVNIGIRPMFEVPQAQVESFIFDFDREIYGQILRVKPVKFLRGEAKYKSVDDLVAQMKLDCAQAKEILRSKK